MTPRSSGVVETILYVAEVNRAAEWYCQVFGFPVIFQQENRLRALQTRGEQVLLLFKEGASTTPTILPGGVIPSHDGSGPAHVAFSMRTEDAEAWEQHLTANEIAIEGRVTWADNDRSLYFRDPDNHLVELISGNHWLNLSRQ